MDLGFVPPDLGRWDLLPVELLAVGIFADERPLRGAAGLLDWRMCGMLSRLIASGRLLGNGGEVLLFPPAGRLAFAKVLVFGLGPARAFDEAAFREVAERMFQVAYRLGADRLAVAPPGRAQGRIGARRALELLLDGLDAAAGERDGDAPPALTVVEESAGQKEMAELWRERRAQGRG